MCFSDQKSAVPFILRLKYVYLCQNQVQHVIVCYSCYMVLINKSLLFFVCLVIFLHPPHFSLTGIHPN